MRTGSWKREYIRFKLTIKLFTDSEFIVHNERKYDREISFHSTEDTFKEQTLSKVKELSELPLGNCKFVCSYNFSSVRLLSDHLLGNSCSLG